MRQNVHVTQKATSGILLRGYHTHKATSATSGSFLFFFDSARPSLLSFICFERVVATGKYPSFIYIILSTPIESAQSVGRLHIPQ